MKNQKKGKRPLRGDKKKLSKMTKNIRKPMFEPSTIKNKQRRRMLVVRNKMMKNKEDILFKLEKRKLEANGQEFEKFAPISQEEKGISIFMPKKPENPKENQPSEANPIEENTDQVDLDADLQKEMENDEFQDFISGARQPKIFLTTMFRTPTRKSYQLLQGTQLINQEIKNLLPQSFFYPRKSFTDFKATMAEAVERGYTHIIRLQEFQNEPYCLEMSMLPYGPSVSLRIRKYVACKDIHNRGVPILTQPEMIFKNLKTSLGARLQRFLGSIFPPQPKLQDRTIISVINQRDFLFFRHHRYFCFMISFADLQVHFRQEIRHFQVGGFAGADEGGAKGRGCVEEH